MRREGLAFPSWRYAVWALVDVEANLLVVMAFRYISVASLTLLDAFAIPSVLVLSRAFLGSRYTVWHLVACLVCMLGLCLTVLSDVAVGQSSFSQDGPAWFGDAAVLAGAALYGLSNVMQEGLLKQGHRRCEALGMLGLWGTLFSGAHAVLWEREAIREIHWDAATVLCLVGFQLCLFSMYTLTSTLLLSSDAAFFNLALLTSDGYAWVYSCLVQHRRTTWTYVAAFVTTVTGLVMYHLQPDPTSAAPASGGGGLPQSPGYVCAQDG